jgi:hypothetical protein
MSVFCRCRRYVDRTVFDGLSRDGGWILDFVDSVRKAKKGECWLRRCEDCNEGVDVRIQARC